MEERKKSFVIEPAVGVQSDASEDGKKVRAATPIDRHAVDLRICLFISALKSLKRHTQLKFPALLRKKDNETEDAYFDRLLSLADEFPSVEALMSGTADIAGEGRDLLSLVVAPRVYSLDSKPTRPTFAKIAREIGHEVNFSLCPTHIFELRYSDPGEGPACAASRRFDEAKARYGASLAYHGSALENFYSIVNNGLQGHLNKTSVFGEGTYLSSDLGVCMNFTKASIAWVRSALGHRLSCVCVCEVIDHPDGVERGSKSQSGVNLTAVNEKVPERYFLAKNNDYVRIKYLFVYAEGAPQKRDDTIMGALRRHKALVAVFVYALFLLIMWFTRTALYRRMLAKLKLAG